MAATLRPATAADGPLLAAMLALAVGWRPGAAARPVAEVLEDPVLARYVDGWPRDGDLGLVAELDGSAVGAAWLRFHSVGAPSYGFVDAATPELALAIRDGHRGQGLGTALITALLDRAREGGAKQVSLSVNGENPARQLYLRLGFVDVHRVEASFTMLRRL